MRNCKNCAFCKRDLINDYIREADLHKCDMDGDVVLDPNKEGTTCSWFTPKSNNHENIFWKIYRYICSTKR